jgi:hypothetical protein
LIVSNGNSAINISNQEQTMSTDKIDPSNKDPKVSSADELTKTTNKSDVELSEEELKRIAGGVFQKVADKWVM